MLVCGREDGFVSWDATLVEFDGCGHAPFLEDGETYRAELLGFLAGLGA